MNGQPMTILSAITNPKDLSDEDLDQLRIDVVMEQQRRSNLTAIPEQIADLAKVYRDGGGDDSVLTDVIQEGGDA